MQLAALSSFTAGTMLSLVGHASAFTPSKATATTQATTALFSSVPSDVSSTSSLSLADLKTDLVRACTKEDKPGLNEIKMLVRDLEDKAEMVGEGQASSITGVMAGEWYVVLCCVVLEGNEYHRTKKRTDAEKRTGDQNRYPVQNAVEE